MNFPKDSSEYFPKTFRTNSQQDLPKQLLEELCILRPIATVRCAATQHIAQHDDVSWQRISGHLGEYTYKTSQVVWPSTIQILSYKSSSNSDVYECLILGKYICEKCEIQITVLFFKNCPPPKIN